MVIPLKNYDDIRSQKFVLYERSTLTINVISASNNIKLTTTFIGKQFPKTTLE